MDFGAIATKFLLLTESLMSLGYLGIIVINFIACSSIIFPIPAFLIIFAAGRFMNPLLVALCAAIGAVFGELIGYGVGRGGGKILEKRHKKFLKKYKKFFRNGIIFPTIIAFAATPLPDDVIGLICGIFGYNIKKFFIATFIGKFIMSTALAFGGYYGIAAILRFFGG